MNLKIPAMLAALLMTVSFARGQEPTAPVTGGGASKPAANDKATNDQKDMARKFFNLGAAPDPAAIDRGQALFVANCGFCHGSSANGGNSGPNLVRSVLVLHDEGTGTEIGPVIRNGRVSKGMPKFPFTDAQIHDVAAWLLSRSQSTANRMEYKILNIVTGDPKAGSAYFGQHCASCHTAAGDLAGVAARYEPVALQARFLYPFTRERGFGPPGAAPSKKAMSTVTVKDASGKMVTGDLVDIDDFQVTVKDASGLVSKIDLDPNDHSNVTIVDPLAEHLTLLKTYSDADMHNILAYLETLK